MRIWKFSKSKGSPPYFFLVFIAFLLFGGCSIGPPLTVVQPEAATIPPSHVFKAGAAETDITPPPGLPLFGYSLEAAKKAEGYWTRLKSKAIVFESKKGERLALVQLDLGAVSNLLHREVARRLNDEGFEPGDLMISASHTHSAPGGFFGVGLYNMFGSGRCGFFYQLVEWLADRIAGSVKEACRDLAPSRIAAGDTMVESLSRNRSKEAWRENFPDNSGTPPYSEIIPRIYVLRVDHLNKKEPGTTTPVAAVVVAPVHATAVGTTGTLYNGDLFGTASRYLAKMVGEKEKCSRSIIAAIIPGPNGDVSPAWIYQGHAEAKRLGYLLAEHAADVFLGLKEQLKEVDSIHIYNEIPLPGAKTSAGDLCTKARVGVPVLGGAEDGRSFLYGELGIREGARHKKPRGCQGNKKTAVGFLQRLLLKQKQIPSIAPLQIIQLGEEIAFATIPGEPTTEVGRRIHGILKQNLDTKYVSLICCANGYMSYISTKQEYAAQHFEGAFTLYGENEAQFFQDNLVRLVKVNNWDKNQSVPDMRTFFPGKDKKIFKKGKMPCKPEEWQSLATRFHHDVNGRLLYVRFDWIGLQKKQYIRELPTIKVHCKKCSKDYPGGIIDSDDGLNFIVRLQNKSHWWLLWIPSKEIITDGPLHISVSRPGMNPILSDEFFLKKE